jgi:hypothetical protein
MIPQQVYDDILNSFARRLLGVPVVSLQQNTVFEIFTLVGTQYADDTATCP